MSLPVTDPFEGTIRTEAPVFEKAILPTQKLSAILPARGASAPNPVREEEGDEDLVIGLFNPKSFGATLREQKFNNGEMVRSLVEIIRTGNDRDKMAAIKQLRDMGKEVLTLNGAVGTATARQITKDEQGNTTEQLVSQTRLSSRLSVRPDTANNPIGVSVTKPLGQKEIDNANLTYPIDRSPKAQPKPVLKEESDQEESSEEDQS
jgi:hypothetical protein